jgi:hypothetical protein
MPTPPLRAHKAASQRKRQPKLLEQRLAARVTHRAPP